MPEPTDDLIAWLRAQLDDDERVARAVAERSWTLRTDRDYPTPDQAFPDHTLWLGERLTGEVGFGDGEIRPSDAEHIALHDPARVLAEVDTKRRRLDLIVELAPHHPEVALRLAKLDALPYADRPGYRQEWKP